jgi:FkbM family methyltransferase
MATREIAAQVDGTRVVVEGSLFGGMREMYGRRVYFTEPECQLPEAGWVVDLGANRGLFSTLAACKGLNVLAIEAQVGFRPAFEARMARNEVNTHAWTLENVLVGAGGILVDEAALNEASHSEGALTPRAPLVDLLDKHEVSEIEFLKCDIEGAEYGLFDDDEWLLRTRRIAMEVHAEFGDPAEIADRIRGRGFTVRLRDADLRSTRTLVETGYLYAWRH